jgi:hypothetical protein
MLGVRWSLLSPAQRAVLLGAAAFVVWFFAATSRDVSDFHGIDLRPKVLGARAMVEGKNPYTYEWTPGASDRFLDPVRRHPGPPRTSIPPTLLLLYAPLAEADYGWQRSFWFGTEWLAGLAAVLVALHLATGRAAKVWFLGIAAFGFIGNWLFRLHVERGQYYVFLALLVALAFTLIRERRDGVGTALMVGLVAAARPTFALVPILLYFAGKRRLALVAIAFCVALCLVTLPLVGVGGWMGYLSVIRYHAEIGDTALERDFGPAIVVPQIAEGLDLRSCLPSMTGNVSFRALYGYFLTVPFSRQSLGVTGLGPLSKTLAALTVVASAVVADWGRRKALGMRFSLALILVATLVADFFLAPRRYSYCDVMLLPLIALLVPVWGRVRSLRPWFAVALFGLVMGATSLGGAEAPLMGLWSVWLRNVGVMVGAAGTVTLALRSRARRTAQPPG